MAFINQAVTVLQTLVIALGAGLAVWGVVNLMEGYGNDNPGAKAKGKVVFVVDGGVVCRIINTGREQTEPPCRIS